MDVRVRGGATSEELAAVLAVLRPAEAVGPPSTGAPDGYERWRRTRQAALRRTAPSR